MKGLAFAYDPDGYWVEIVKNCEKICKLCTHRKVDDSLFHK